MNIQGVENIGDAGAIAILLGAIGGYLTPAATALTIIWLAIRIYDYFSKKKYKKDYK